MPRRLAPRPRTHHPPRTIEELAAFCAPADLPYAWWPPVPDQPDDQADDDAGVDVEGRARRVRSTRRRQDVAELPRQRIEDRTVGETFTGRDGKVWRPSMFVTLTLDTYGPVDATGAAHDPETHDYRRAALDALHFPKLVDRFWQNLRRAVGWKVQYFASIEAQRRFAPHLHAAIRGRIRRRIIRQVRAATYHQVLWPAHDIPVYVARLPRWDDHTGGYTDPPPADRYSPGCAST